MNIVSPLRPTRPPDTGNPSQVHFPLPAVLAALDQATDGKWSSEVIRHEVVGNETVVIVRLIVDGRSHAAFGGTSEKGPLVQRLQSATLDALTRAAGWMGIQTAAPAITPQPAIEPVPATPAESTARITRKQLDYAISLARDRGIARDRLTSHCLAECGRKPEYLTRAEASALIESLKKEAA